MVTLGRLETVSVQAAWSGEATDFTPWLAREANLALLGQELGMEIELVEIESSVGPFKVDILARHAGTLEMIVIENQFEIVSSSHDVIPWDRTRDACHGTHGLVSIQE